MLAWGLSGDEFLAGKKEPCRAREKERFAGFAWEKGHRGGLAECRLATGVCGPSVGEGPTVGS